MSVDQKINVSVNCLPRVKSEGIGTGRLPFNQWCRTILNLPDGILQSTPQRDLKDRICKDVIRGNRKRFFYQYLFWKGLCVGIESVTIALKHCFEFGRDITFISGIHKIMNT